MGVTVEINDRDVKRLLANLASRHNKIAERDRSYVGLLSAIVFRDLDSHFFLEEGPNGRWANWSRGYTEQMIKKGKQGNLILQDTGRLRAGWQPARYRVSREGVLWYNPVAYARKHDEGIGVPARPFAWISDRAVDQIVDQTHKFLGFN